MENGKDRCGACTTTHMPCNEHDFAKRMNKFACFRYTSILIIFKYLQGIQRAVKVETQTDLVLHSTWQQQILA